MFSKEYGTRQTPSDTSVYVLNCLFRTITSTSSGGALYCSSPVTHLLVESSSFFSCNSSGIGGAVCFSNSGGVQCILLEVCGYDCRTISGGNGPFSYNNLNDATSTKNFINYSSISRCGTEISNPYYMICHFYGTHCYPSVNISMNKCCSRSGICSGPSVDSNSVTCSISYSTFADNIATGHICIQLSRTGAKYEIKSCNILRNAQGTLGKDGTIATWGTTMIEDSCILENKATNVFYQGDTNYRTTLSKCTVDSTSNNGYLTTQSTSTKSFILALNHISTQNCHSEYDSAGTLTPIIPSQSSSKKQKLYYSYQRLFHQCQLSDVVSLANILIFNFINPYASCDPFY
jgi:hypothetical protein